MESNNDLPNDIPAIESDDPYQPESAEENLREDLGRQMEEEDKRRTEGGSDLYQE